MSGKLKYLGKIRNGYYVECVDCETRFPDIDGEIKCNGCSIYKCPWCREDSKPWRNGRGL